MIDHLIVAFLFSQNLLKFKEKNSIMIFLAQIFKYFSQTRFFFVFFSHLMHFHITYHDSLFITFICFFRLCLILAFIL